MSSKKPELLAKLNSLLNHYGNNKNFVEHMDEWPRTIKELIYSSMELMIRFKLVELIPKNEEDPFIGME